MVFVRRPNDPVRDPVDLAKRVREKFIRNEEFITKAAKMCNYSNRPERLCTRSPNLLMLTRQFRKVNYELIDKSVSRWNESRWILPNRDISRHYYRKHHDVSHAIPDDCNYVSLVFSAERAHFIGGSIRVRFYKKYHECIFTRTISIPAEIRTRCWEFTRPKMAAYFSASFRLHQVKDEHIKPKIPERTMTLRSETTTKTINPATGQWCYRKISK